MNQKFIDIFTLYKNDIYRLIYSYTKDFNITDDIIQTTFIKLYKHEEVLKKSKEEIKKWLIVVAINSSKTYLLSYWKNKISYLTEKEENTLTREESSNQLLDTILELPKKYRIPLFLYYYEDYKIKEIAQILKLSETCIQTRLARARNLLKEKLKEELHWIIK